MPRGIHPAIGGPEAGGGGGAAERTQTRADPMMGPRPSEQPPRDAISHEWGP